MTTQLVQHGIIVEQLQGWNVLFQNVRKDVGAEILIWDSISEEEADVLVEMLPPQRIYIPAGGEQMVELFDGDYTVQVFHRSTVLMAMTFMRGILVTIESSCCEGHCFPITIS